jgi:zinc transport system substrate-binding protein
MRNLLLLICFLTALYALPACTPSGGDSTASQDYSVFVSIVPLEFFAERVGGPYVELHSLVGPGQSPATYEPTTKQMTALADSKVFFITGVPVEAPLVPRIRSGFPSVEVVDVRDGMPMQEVAVERLVDGSPEMTGYHHETDPHVWLSPRLAKTIAKKMSDTFSKIDPDHKAEYVQNYQRLAEELDRLDSEITQLLSPVRGRELIVFHPAYGHFANEYGLEQIAIEHGGVAPGSRQLALLIENAREKGVKAIFVQPQFSSTAAEAVAGTIGAEVIQLDPLARDYVENLWDIAIKIHSAFEDG